MSIFHNRSPVPLQLNPTLSQGVRELDDANDSVAIENLKAVLFRDIHEVEKNFLIFVDQMRTFASRRRSWWWLFML